MSAQTHIEKKQKTTTSSRSTTSNHQKVFCTNKTCSRVEKPQSSSGIKLCSECRCRLSWRCIGCDKVLTFGYRSRQHRKTCQTYIESVGTSSGSTFNIQRYQRAETVLRSRIFRFILVVENPFDLLNVSAILRTVDCLGIHQVYIIHQAEKTVEMVSKSIGKSTQRYLDIQFFESTKQCVDMLRANNIAIWTTELSPDAVRLDKVQSLPPQRQKIALVMGREVDGISPEMSSYADRRVYFPMYGFTESLNLSVASALIVNTLIGMDPQCRGNFDDAPSHDYIAKTREKWYRALSKTPSTCPLPDQLQALLKNPPTTLDELRKDSSMKYKSIKKRKLNELVLN